MTKTFNTNRTFPIPEASSAADSPSGLWRRAMPASMDDFVQQARQDFDLAMWADALHERDFPELVTDTRPDPGLADAAVAGMAAAADRFRSVAAVLEAGAARLRAARSLVDQPATAPEAS